MMATGERTLPKTSPTFCYYRQPNGWITRSPSTSLEELKYRRDGWEPLKGYGSFEMSTGYAAEHKFELLFMLGGAHELCDEQIIAEGIYMDTSNVPVCRLPFAQHHPHHTPDCWVGAKPVVLPQLGRLKQQGLLGPFSCRFCDREFAEAKGRDQHSGVMHQEQQGQERTGEVLAEALLKGLGGAKDVPVPVEQSAVAAMAQELLAMREELAAMKRAATPRRRGANRVKTQAGG